MHLLVDLRRRRVFRLAGLYIVGAWIVIEVASVFFPAWGIPDTALRYLFIGAALIFPVAVVFAWKFDITADGIVRTGPADHDESVDLSLKKTDYAILAALAGVAAMVVLGSLEQVAEQIDHAPAVTVTEKLPNSIAVLPFENVGGNEETAYYSDGISEAILSKLASLPSLRVLARTTSFAFRDSERPLRDIADVLGVRFLLSGTLRREEDAVYMSATLVDESGFEVWGDAFETRAGDIFSVQDTIARQVASHIKDDIAGVGPLPGATTSATAYRHYLIGRQYANSRPPGWEQPAGEQFRKAIAEDPQFAPAYAGLAMALYIGGNESERMSRQEQALEMATRALALQPELGEVQAVMGLVLLDGDSAALREARGHLERALELDPSFSDAYNWLAGALNQLGLPEDAARVQELGLEIDPLNPPLVTNVADRILSTGDFDRALALRMRLLEVPEPPGVGLWGIYQQYFEYDDIAEAIYWAKQTALAYRGTRNQLAFFSLAMLYAQLGLTDEANYWNAMLETHHPDRLALLLRQAYLAKLGGDSASLSQAADELQAMEINRPDRLFLQLRRRIGAILVVAGRPEIGIPLLEEALQIDSPMSPRYASHETAEITFLLANAYRSRGDDDLAELTFDRAREIVLLLRSDNVLRGSPSEIELLVMQHVFRGDLDSAAIAMRTALDAGWSNYYWFYNDRFMHDSAQSPELAPLFEEALRKVEEHRRIVLERDANDNFKERIALMMQDDAPPP